MGKLFPFALIGLVQACLVTAVTVWGFRVPLRGSLLTLMLLTQLFLLNTLGLGLLVFTLVRTQQQAMMGASFLLMLPMVYLSGLIFPIENMPRAVQYLTYAIPLRYYAIIIRGVFLKGSGIAALWPEAAALAVIGVGILTLASTALPQAARLKRAAAAGPPKPLAMRGSRAQESLDPKEVTMRMTRAARALAAIALILAAGTVVAQETKQQAGAPEMPVPKPGPEHQLFQQDAGSWDATVEMFMAPGAPPMVSKGVETNTVGCGGLCLISDFKGEMAPGQAFHGHGTSAWDPAKKKYVGTWTDSMSAGIAVGESSYDPASKTATGWVEGPDMTGKVVKSKAVVQYKDANTRVFTMYQTGPDGKEVPGMKISYTRKQ